MRYTTFMVIAGEPSGDVLAAELVQALRDAWARLPHIPATDYQPRHKSLEPRFCGAGGPRMASEGVEFAFDLTTHAVTGLTDAVMSFPRFWRLLRRLRRLALERQP